tara:strand:+ start:94 stop:534 length:441 start_codon:yes stop_codon:yes gene_type:complete
MHRLNFYYFTFILFFSGCDNSLTGSGDDSNLISISFGSISNDNIEIIIDTYYDIGGFQFTITGSTITGFNGGMAQEYGFSIANNPDTGIIIGYSLSANTIPAGSSGILTNITYINQISEICITDVVFSDPDALALNDIFIGECIEY